MTFDDKQLDDLLHSLRDVEVPESLKQTLREIPKSEVVGLPEGSPVVTRNRPLQSNRTAWYTLAAVAAALVLLMTLAFWPEGGNQNGSIADSHGTVVAPNGTATDGGLGSMPDVAAARPIELDLIEMRMQNIEALLLQREIRRLETRLAELKRPRLQPFAPEEKESLALSLSFQTAMESGVSLDVIRDDLLQVVKRYPGSQGAEIANQLLTAEKTNEEFHN